MQCAKHHDFCRELVQVALAQVDWSRSSIKALDIRHVEELTYVDLSKVMEARNLKGFFLAGNRVEITGVEDLRPGCFQARGFSFLINSNFEISKGTVETMLKLQCSVRLVQSDVVSEWWTCSSD